MSWQPLLGGLLIFSLRLIDVSMGTVRMLMVVRGRKFLAALIGFFEVMIFLLAISKVVREVGNFWNVLGYCGGFATGTIVGMTLEQRLALGFSVVRIISKTRWLEITQALRQESFGATQVIGEGKDGPVGIIYSIVRRRQVPAVVALCERLDPQAFITVEEAGQVYRGYLGRAVK
ncbi:MAG: DUF2179 domain-containing protein [Anaerolineae bacterium]|nr:DUF2179 domain-containing protein [Anaerolineae bacterium]